MPRRNLRQTSFRARTAGYRRRLQEIHKHSARNARRNLLKPDQFEELLPKAPRPKQSLEQRLVELLLAILLLIALILVFGQQAELWSFAR